MRISLGKVVIVLAILTIAMTVAAVYAYASPNQTGLTITDNPAKAGEYIKLYEISWVPDEYYELDEDPYMRASVENPDKWVWVGPDRLWKPWMIYVKVNGKYYSVACMEVISEPVTEPKLQDFIPPAFFGLGVCWIGVGVTTYRRNRKKEK